MFHVDLPGCNVLSFCGDRNCDSTLRISGNFITRIALNGSYFHPLAIHNLLGNVYTAFINMSVYIYIGGADHIYIYSFTIISPKQTTCIYIYINMKT